MTQRAPFTRTDGQPVGQPTRKWTDPIAIDPQARECPAWLKGAKRGEWRRGEIAIDAAPEGAFGLNSWRELTSGLTASRLLDEGWEPASTMPDDGSLIQRMWSDGRIGIPAWAEGRLGAFVVTWKLATPAEAPQADGWIEHDGGGLPEAARQCAHIDIRVQNGKEYFRVMPNPDGDAWARMPGVHSGWWIVAWRPVVETKATESEKPANRAPTPKQVNPNRRMLVTDRWGERKTSRLAASREQASIAQFFATQAGKPDDRLLWVAGISKTGR